MNTTERWGTIALALIFASRMLGLFMILPVFALYAHQLSGSTAVTIGIALGIYGLTQACLQMPFGLLSDKFGRKPLLFLGMAIFVIGSVVAALSHSIWGVIIGRALQGAGAVGSVIIAYVADITREQQRTKAMAIIGLTIGLSFMAAMILGPVLNAWINVSGIFWLTAVLALASFGLTYLLPLPQQQVIQPDAETVPVLLRGVLADTELLRLDAAIFCLHAILTAMFVAIPILLVTQTGIPEARQWVMYLPVLLLAFLAMLPFIIIAEKRHKMKEVLIAAIALLGLVQLGFIALPHSFWTLFIELLCFFTAFTLLEATLPSLISKMAPQGSKGTAMGVYSTCQFLGVFVGGSVGGWLYGQHNVNGVFVFCAVLALIWLGLAFTMRRPNKLLSK
ncbi:MAG: MFS transporter [Gammaproteobacteria bacterium]|nr:MFS transporter [Gammaproteobacteria bacterium]